MAEGVWRTGDVLSDLLHALAAADERRRDEVHILLDTEADVLLVLVRHGGEARDDAGEVDALALADGVGVEHNAAHPVAPHRLHLQRDQAVVEQHARADLHHLRQPRVVDEERLLVAVAVHRRVRHQQHLRALRQRDLRLAVLPALIAQCCPQPEPVQLAGRDAETHDGTVPVADWQTASPPIRISGPWVSSRTARRLLNAGWSPGCSPVSGRSAAREPESSECGRPAA